MLISGFGFSGFLTMNGVLEPEYRNAINVRFFACEVSLLISIKRKYLISSFLDVPNLQVG